MWTLGSAVGPAEIEQIDANLFKAVNGDEGGTWAPSTPIVIGGSGLDVPGPLTAADATLTEVDITSGSAVFDGSLTIDGATATVTSGGAIVMASGSDLEVQSGGTIHLGNNVWPAFSAARSARYACTPYLVGLTDVDGNAVTNVVFTPWAIPASDAAGPTIVVTGATASPRAGSAFIGLPRVAANATVTSAVILIKGWGVFSDIAPATFTLCRRDISGAVVDLCSPVADPHNVGNWTTAQPVVLNATANQANGFGSNGHFIKCGIPTQTSGTGGYHVLMVYAEAEHSDLRR